MLLGDEKAKKQAGGQNETAKQGRANKATQGHKLQKKTWWHESGKKKAKKHRQTQKENGMQTINDQKPPHQRNGRHDVEKTHDRRASSTGKNLQICKKKLQTWVICQKKNKKQSKKALHK